MRVCAALAALGLFAPGLLERHPPVLSMTAAARPRAAAGVAEEHSAAAVADWRLQMVDRIERAAHSRSGYQEGLVKVSFRIDRAGNLLASEVAESSHVLAFDAEALAMLERAHPFPPPPEGVAGAFVSLSVPIRFRQAPQAADDEKLRYLNLKADLTLTLDGAPSRARDWIARSTRRPPTRLLGSSFAATRTCRPSN